ncbi:N-6 DNA methylase [Nonomuraea helvata]|uniref:N-6 DNA methylase n=1 Tax=Nonomuraea helvata TaxID=37484 RepID=A0ABV5SJZ7_9ACTN
MARRRRQAGPDARQFDLFTMAPQSTAPLLSTPTPATTTQLPTPSPTPQPALTTAAARQAPPDAHLVDGDRRYRLSRRSAADLAERAAEAWHQRRAGSDIAIPMGIVAGLTLLRKTGTDGTDTARFVLGLDKRALLKFHQRIWGYVWIRHPYLVEIARPIHEWLSVEEDPPAKAIDAVHALTHTMIRNGLLDITGDPDPMMRCEADLLGMVLTQMRSERARLALAEVHTPPDMADLIVRVLFDRGGNLKPGQWIDEPTAGTGGLLRSTALLMRMQGMNPHEFGWSLGEIDPIAAACAAVNAVVWDLGGNVLIHVGDTLATGNGPSRAYEHRKAVEAHYEKVMDSATTAARFIAALRKAKTLMGTVEKSRQHPHRTGPEGHLGAAVQARIVRP